MLIKMGEFNHLINFYHFLTRVGSSSSSTSEAQHVEYLTEMGGKLLK
jgi:hypothetical protein